MLRVLSATKSRTKATTKTVQKEKPGGRQKESRDNGGKRGGLKKSALPKLKKAKTRIRRSSVVVVDNPVATSDEVLVCEDDAAVLDFHSGQDAGFHFEVPEEDVVPAEVVEGEGLRDEEGSFDPSLLGRRLGNDLLLRTTSVVICAVCSERKSSFKVSSVVLEKSEIPYGVFLDEKGIISNMPLDNDSFVQVYMCGSCSTNGCVSWRHAQFNVHGLGMMDKDIWWSEELCISTVSLFMNVKHSGQGGHSLKQESKGGVSFAFHDVLKSLSGLLDEGWSEERIAVSRAVEGRGGGGHSFMLVRVKKMFTFFMDLWMNNELYRTHCFQCSHGEWTEERVMVDLLPKIAARLQLQETPFNQVRKSKQHLWPWKVEDGWTVRKFFLGVGGSVDLRAGVECEVLVRSMPSLFSRVSEDTLKSMKESMYIGKLAKHLALLSDNRICRHDRALFVLDWLVVRSRIRGAMFKKGKIDSVIVGLEKIDDVVKELKEDLAKEEAGAKERQRQQQQKSQQPQQQQQQQQEPQQVKDKEEEKEKTPLVSAFIKGLKMYARDVLGHPMARAGYRGQLKAYHRMVNPGNIWLTINISDKDNEWLRRMYNLEEGVVPDYECVKSGGVVQAIFFDEYVRSLLDNVLMAGEDGIFGELEWVGGTVEWCQEGRPHFHFLACAKKVAPQSVSDTLKKEGGKEELEKWVGLRFCESVGHEHESDAMKEMSRKGGVTHEHSQLCTKYQTPSKDGKFRCRFEYGRALQADDNGFGAEMKMTEQDGKDGWQWLIARDHGMALCHSDGLYDVHFECGGMAVNQYCQFFGGSGEDGQRVIAYCTNYTTKMGLSRIELKRMLLEVAEEARRRRRSTGSVWSGADMVSWMMKSTLMRIAQATPIPQAQAALNVLELKEFYMRTDNEDGHKIVPLFSNPLADYDERRTKKNKTVPLDPDVEDYVMRGQEFDSYSPMKMASEGWRKEEKTAETIGVAFKIGHSQEKTHWMRRKAVVLKKRGSNRKTLLHIFRRRFHVVTEEAREKWAKSIALAWRTKQETDGVDWKVHAVEHEADEHVATMKRVIRMEDLNGKLKKMKKDEHVGDEVEKEQQKDVVEEIFGEDDWRKEEMSVGGQAGERIVMVARLSGLLPKSVVEKKLGLVRSDNFSMSTSQWKQVKGKPEENEEVQEEDDAVDDEVVTPKCMEEILDQWKRDSTVIPICNREHFCALLLCVLYLADVFCGKKGLCPFSLVVQGAGGTGKTATIIAGVREFVKKAVEMSHCKSWLRSMLLMAPTNMAAQAIGGVTLDSGLFNRRGKTSKEISRHVKIVVVDEYSMVSHQWLEEIEQALRQEDGSPFGGVSLVWIGDAHQLGPVKGKALYDDQGSARRHWTGEQWLENVRKSYAVVMKTQYRMTGQLAGIAERFANGEQLVEDAKAVVGRTVKGKTSDEWKEKLAENKVKVLCFENNVKAGLNWEMVKWMREGKEWFDWACEDKEKGREASVIEQIEPMQCVWPWMPVISLENYPKTKVSNGTLCWVVKVIVEQGSSCPKSLIVVAAAEEHEAKEKVRERGLEDLLAKGEVVAMKKVLRGQRRGFPFSPSWVMTLHKVQGATLQEAVLHMEGKVDAHSIYMGLSRVRELGKLWILGDVSSSLILNTRFDKGVKAEMERLKRVERRSLLELKRAGTQWKIVAELLGDIHVGEEEVEVEVDQVREERKEDEDADSEHALKNKKTKLVTSYEWAVAQDNGTVTDGCMAVNCNGFLFAEENGERRDAMDWKTKLATYSVDQQMRVARVWRMEQKWNDKRTRGKKRTTMEKRVKKKEKENDWKKVLAKETWGKMRKKLK